MNGLFDETREGDVKIIREYFCDKHDLPGLISKHFADKTRELEIGIGIG